jgi:signal transduction histidine kinase
MPTHSTHSPRQAGLADRSDGQDSYAPLALALSLAVAGLAVVAAFLGGAEFVRAAAVLAALGSFGVAASAYALLRRWRRSAEDRFDAADKALQRTHQFEATQAAVISMVAHELRTPLQTLTSGIELFEMAPSSRERSTRVIAGMHHAIEQIEGRLRNLSQYSLSAAPCTEAFALKDLLLRIVDDHRGLAAQAGHALQAELPPAIDTVVQGDPVRLHQIVSNYLNNAVQHASPGVILLRAGLYPSQPVARAVYAPFVQIEVIDHGPGVSEVVGATLWTTFVTTKKERSQLTGGLGLAVVRLLADAAGWDVGVRPTPGGGATFYVVFPAGRSES